ncbi:MAG: serine hydrolase [Acidobacteriia bacterium]|nr:serine hydrolase [Terriglobia bacterium]
MPISRVVPKLLAVSCAVLGLAPAPPARAQQEANAAVDAVFADVAKPGSPGCALGVYREGKMIYARGYGLADLEQSVPITPQSVFDIGSTSKQFTVTSVLLLEKQGKLSVNDDVRKYIPELPEYGGKITILHLMNHTSGLRDYLTLFELAGINTDSVTTDEDALAIIARQKALNFAPGSDWLYSNTGFFLLSVIVKRVSGQPLAEFAAENIFTPLGMTHTQFRDDHTSLIAKRALAYDPTGKGGYKLDVSYFEQTGDGAVHTSVEDLLRWDENFYSAQIGGKAYLAEIQERGKLASGKALEYAKGLFVGDYRALHTVSHGGSWGGYRAELLRFPEQHFSVACLCNVGNANPEKRARQVAEVYLGGLMKAKEEKREAEDLEKQKPEIALAAEQLRAYTGDYWSEELGVTYRLALAGEKMKLAAVLDRTGLPRTGHALPIAWRATAADEFAASGAPLILHFRRGANGAVSGFTLDAGRTRDMIFLRRESAAEREAK